MTNGLRKSKAIDLLVVIVVPVFLPMRIEVEPINSDCLIVSASGWWIGVGSSIGPRLRTS